MKLIIDGTPEEIKKCSTLFAVVKSMEKINHFDVTQ